MLDIPRDSYGTQNILLYIQEFATETSPIQIIQISISLFYLFNIQFYIITTSYLRGYCDLFITSLHATCLIYVVILQLINQIYLIKRTNFERT